MSYSLYPVILLCIMVGFALRVAVITYARENLEPTRILAGNTNDEKLLLTVGSAALTAHLVRHVGGSMLFVGLLSAVIYTIVLYLNK